MAKRKTHTSHPHTASRNASGPVGGHPATRRAATADARDDRRPDLGRSLGLVSPRGAGQEVAGAQLMPLGYIDGLLWRLVVFPAHTADRDPVPQLQHQHPGSDEWEVVAHDDLLAHLTWQAYRRGHHSAAEHRSPSSLLVPGQGER